MTNGIERWAVEEFGHAQLKDRRRTERLIRLAAAAASDPNGTITRTVKTGAEREGAYRFLENPEVSAEAIGAAMCEATCGRIGGRTRIVVAVDQSTVSITDRTGSKGLGRTGGRTEGCVRRGFEVMTALGSGPDAVRLGVLAQAWHVRSDTPSPPRNEDSRPIAERESGLWPRCIQAAMEALSAHAPNVRPWFQLDRGADINHVLEAVFCLNADVTIRSTHNRRLDEGGYLHDTLRSSSPLGTIQTVIVDSHAPRGVARIRPVRLVVRARRVVLRLQDPHGARYGAMPITAVHVTEAEHEGSSDLEWFLLTNVDAHSLEQAYEVVRSYRARWSVEDFHRAWKEGVCHVEKSQLRSADAFRRWATILTAVAARAERLKTLSRAEPDRDALDEFSQTEIDAIFVLTKTLLKKNAPAFGTRISLGEAVEMIAFIGGYTGRKNSGGPPGATVIGRGLDALGVAAAVLQGVRQTSG